MTQKSRYGACAIGPRFALTLDRASGVDVQDQIVQQIRGGIVDGRLQPGQNLPAVQKVATKLEVSPVTVQQAYTALAAKHLTTATNKGTVICEPPKDATRTVLLEQMDAMVRRMRSFELSIAEVQEIFEEALQNWFVERGKERRYLDVPVREERRDPSSSGRRRQ